MKKNKCSYIVFMILWFTFFIAFSIICVDGRKNHHTKKTKTHKNHKQRGGGSGGGGHDSSGFCFSSNVFNILSFGAKGDGFVDDSKALLGAWKAACKLQCASAKIEIPTEYNFLIKPVTLQGPCFSDLILQMDGNLLAPPKLGSWSKSSLYQWINIKWINNFTIQGNGSFDGQGSNWWKLSQMYNVHKKSQKIRNMKPTALRFYASYNVTVKDITIINSPQCHLKFDSSRQIKVNNITIFSPENSPNTDGIHLQNTQDVEIQHSNVGSGDDCVSIQTGCNNIYVHHINCGPGHGISIGGLGKDRSIACVSNVVIDYILMQNTMYGVRIKTWQGGIGSVKNVSFTNIQVTDVKVPIMIDQYYCDKKLCKNQTEAVAISGVKYKKIIGTYSNQPIQLACSNEIPCTNVDLIDIQLSPSIGIIKGSKLKKTLCWNSYGKMKAPLVPSSIDFCLRRDDKGISRRSYENLC